MRSRIVALDSLSSLRPSTPITERILGLCSGQRPTKAERKPFFTSLTAVFHGKRFISHSRVTRFQGFDGMKNESLNHQGIVNPPIASNILTQLNDGKLLVVNSRRRNGLIIYKKFHAEFAGPGAAVGSCFDLNCEGVLPVGDLDLIHPENHEERQKAYLIRRQWIRLTQQLTDNPAPMQRVQMILNQFENYFEAEATAQLPDEAFERLVGVLPHTVQMVRRGSASLKVEKPRN